MKSYETEINRSLKDLAESNKRIARALEEIIGILTAPAIVSFADDEELAFERRDN